MHPLYTMNILYIVGGDAGLEYYVCQTVVLTTHKIFSKSPY